MVIKVPLSEQGKFAGYWAAKVDDCDSWVLESRWAVSMGKKIYARGGEDKRLMHRAIMEHILGRYLKRDEFVDHINWDGLDNRRENLRVATTSQNAINSNIPKNNTSGYKGVSWNRLNKKWQATIGYQGKAVYLGLFSSPEEAHEAYLEAAKKYYGEFANGGEIKVEEVHIEADGFQVGVLVRLTETLEIRAEDKLGFWVETFAFSKGDTGIISLAFSQTPDIVRVNFGDIHWVVETKNLEVVE